MVSNLLATTLSGYLAALYHVPCPPFEWPMMITFSGANAHAFHLEDVSRMVVSAETVAQASSALGPCQSKPYGFQGIS